MIDNEIMKALECCSRVMECKDCDLCTQCETDPNAYMKLALDLINRLKAEIERLKPFEKKVLEPVIKEFQRRDCPFSPFDEYCTGHCVNCENRLECVDCSKHLKIEAYKELAEELKRHCSDLTISDANEQLSVCILWDAEEVIDGIIKDMIEENR
jgi:hypothetical protein